MSSRQIRKIYGTTVLPPLEGNSDEEFEPLYCKGTGTSSKYQGFQISSHSESENDVNDEDNVVIDQQDKTKKKKKKKKKQRKAKIEQVDQDSENVNPENLDEIDAAVLEVNSMFSELPSPSGSEPVEKEQNLQKELFSVRSKFLNYQDEARRFYGLDAPGEETAKKRSHNTKCTRPVLIPVNEEDRFYRAGISMSLLKQEDGRSYFVYNHSHKYQIMHKNFMLLFEAQRIFPLEELQSDKNLEGLYTFTNYLFQAEEYSTAKSVVELIISNLQYNAHHTFIMTNQNHLLEYKYTENRVFHLVAMRHMLMLSNKALHRTALEVCKLLLNLDPSDPLAVMLIIDTIALRAREYKWFIDVIQYWVKTKKIQFFFNLKFSYALAHFHYARNNKLDNVAYADQLLKEAITHHPVVAGRLFKAMLNKPDPLITNHYLFSTAFETKYPMGELMDTMADYQVKMVFPKWREPPVYAWATRTIHEFIREYDDDESLRNRVTFLASKKYGKFVNCSLSIARHAAVVQPMSKFLGDWDMKMPSTWDVQPWDPFPPPDGINRYKYGIYSEEPSGNEEGNYYRRIVRDFIYSLAPRYNPDAPENRRNE